MIRVKRSTLVTSAIGIGILTIGLGIFSFLNNGIIKINIPKTKIESVLNEKMPLTQNINVSEKLPKSLSILKPHVENLNIVVYVDDVKTKFQNDNIEINAIGEIKLNNKIIPFNVLTNGKPEYRDYSFFFKANDLKINTDKEPYDLLKEYVLSKVLKENNEKIDSKVAKIDKKIEEKLGKYSSLFGVAKDELKKQNIVATPEIDQSSLITSVLNEKIFNNQEHNQYINNLVNDSIKSMVTNIINNKPLYVLKDSMAEEGIKLGLKNIFITESGVDIELSTAKILFNIILIVVVLFVILFIIVVLLRNPQKTLFGIIEITVDVASATADAVSSIDI